MSATTPQRVTRLNYARSRRKLELTFEDDAAFELSAEYLRVFSPSAEVRGHGAGQEILQTGKSSVQIVAIAPVGHYAAQITFDDGHDSGLYSWSLSARSGRTARSILATIPAAACRGRGI